MSITYRIDPAARLVHTKIEGRIGLEDALSHAYLLKSDPHFDPDYSNLIDLSEFTGSDLHADALKALARGLQGEVFSPAARRAVVAPAESAFDLSRKFQSMRPESGNFQVFHTMQEALQWLRTAPSRTALFE